MRIAVLGAGNAGQAFAGGMTRDGHDVHLTAVPGHDEQIRVIQTFGGLMVEGSDAAGKEGGFAELNKVDTDVAGAIRNAEVAFVVVPAFGQEVYFQALAENAPDGLVVVIQPGKFGALRLAQVLREHGRDPHSILITETDTFLYAAKMHGLDRIWLRGVKNELPLAALPAARTDEALEVLRRIHSQYVAAPNVLFTSVGDAAYALHPVTTLLDLSRLEQMGPYRTKAYSITPQVARMVKAVDDERCQVAAALGFTPHPLQQQMHDMYGLDGATIDEALLKTTVHVDQMTPRSAQHRYVTEEVPYGLVPLSELGTLFGLPTPNIDTIITLASTVNDVDYRSEGRHLASLGLDDVEPEHLSTWL